VAVLQAHAIAAVADVRRFPGSRRHPHFGRDQLEPLLGAHGIEYHWLPDLGGRRTPRKDSPNTGWRVSAFRGYADYMDTTPFRDAFSSLDQLSRRVNTAVMCAEALWWQCHRRLIADAFLAQGAQVLHIQSEQAAVPHRLIPPAHVRDGRLSYAAEQMEL
jgi:uncharacterized protein (DUF488 family)